MIALENPPGFVVRTEAGKAAWDNGFRLERGTEGGWQRYGSTTAPGSVWIAGASAQGPWLLSVDHTGVVSEIETSAPSSPLNGPGLATFIFTTLMQLHAALDRVYRLAVSLPDAPLVRFRAKTVTLPRTTEAERLVIQRIGQDIFRDALMDYWGRRCPLTGITDAALLRASHILPWAECSDEQRLDVHNGLLLSALWDAAFDKGLVSFADDGQPLASPQLSEAAREALGIAAAPPIPGLQEEHRRNLALHRSRHGLELTSCEQRLSEPMGLQADGSIKTYTPEEWEPMGLQADGSIKTYTLEEWEELEAALRIGSYPPEMWEQAKAVMRFKWQRGYDDAMAGRPMPERALYEYFDGYDTGKAKLSGNSAPSKG